MRGDPAQVPKLSIGAPTAARRNSHLQLDQFRRCCSSDETTTTTTTTTGGGSAVDVVGQNEQVAQPVLPPLRPSKAPADCHFPPPVSPRLRACRNSDRASGPASTEANLPQTRPAPGVASSRPLSVLTVRVHTKYQAILITTSTFKSSISLVPIVVYARQMCIRKGLVRHMICPARHQPILLVSAN